MDIKDDLVKDAMQVSPAVATTGGFYMFGLPLSDIVALASIILICVQTGYRLWKWKIEKRQYEESLSNKLSSNSNSPSDNSSV